MRRGGFQKYFQFKVLWKKERSKTTSPSQVRVLLLKSKEEKSYAGYGVLIFIFL